MSNFILRLFQNISLRRVVNTRKKDYISIKDAKRVGFVFNVNEEGVEQAIPILEKQLQSHKVNFQGIAFDLSEEQAGIPKFQSDPYVINLYKSDLNWIGIPNHDLFSKYIDAHFDIFIDLSLKPIFPIDYLVNVVNSTVIVGFRPKMISKYDILIQSKEDSSPKLSDFVMNTLNYLTTIKSNK